MWKRYGLTSESYYQLLSLQGGGCALCGSNDPGRGWRYLAVDHDHSTGKVRGLLCGGCNASLSEVVTVQWLRKAIGYLMNPPARRLDEKNL